MALRKEEMILDHCGRSNYMLKLGVDKRYTAIVLKLDSRQHIIRLFLFLHLFLFITQVTRAHSFHHLFIGGTSSFSAANYKILKFSRYTKQFIEQSYAHKEKASASAL